MNVGTGARSMDMPTFFALLKKKMALKYNVYIIMISYLANKDTGNPFREQGFLSTHVDN